MYWHRRLDAGHFFEAERPGPLAAVLTIFCLVDPIQMLPNLNGAAFRQKTICLPLSPAHPLIDHHLAERR
jgi:hypothetical protein